MRIVSVPFSVQYSRGESFLRWILGLGLGRKLVFVLAVAIFAYLLIMASSADAAGRKVSVIATAYAPLDSRAKKGVCHNGNPYTVAYGNTNPDIDISASWDFPAKTWVYIGTEFNGAPIGWRQVNDRFGSYEKTKHIRNRIDISMWGQSTAFRWGTRKITVLVGGRR